jgi:fermentation-respiration switch protein FrsA (DUF1100 family)
LRFRPSAVRELFWFSGVAVAAYVAVLGGLYLFQRQLLYHPDRARPQLGALAQLGVREIAVPTADGLSLLSWYLPPRGGGPVVVYFHGNGGHIGYRAGRVERFARKGYGVLMLEYRGYGGNPGTPGGAGFLRDAEAALRFVDAQGVQDGRLVLFGESLGSGVAVPAAAGREIGALVLEAPFTSIVDAAQYHYPFAPAALLVSDRYDSLSRIGEVKAPILMLHGARDGVVPASLGEALFAAAPEPKQRWVAPHAGHEGLDRHGALDVVIAFIDRHLP